jgi:DNA-binding LacI/PurR family transcriptional regulator
MAKTARATISDVAAAAGVSPTAVSQILNNKGNFPDSTKDRVRQVASDLGYRASRAAASLRTGQSRVVGIVIAGSNDPLWSSQWLSVTARILVDAAEELNRNDYSLLVIPSGSIGDSTFDELDALILSDSLIDDPIIDLADGAGIPVLTNDRLDDPRISVHVDSGYREMTEFAYRHFSENNRKKPVLITEPDVLASDASAELVWRQLCDADRVEPMIEHVDYDRQNLEESVLSVLNQGADAIYSFAGDGNDIMAIIDRAGKRVPDDVWLVSSEMESFITTPTLAYDALIYHADQGAKDSVRLLLKLLSNELPTPQTVKLGWALVEAGKPITP